MRTSQELPEHQFFHILRQGEEQPIGPYSQNQLVELLNEGTIQTSDYVFYESLKEWTPLSKVFDVHQQISNFDDDGQDSQVVEDAFTFLTSRSEPNEEIFYIATQHQPALSLTAAVLLSHPKAIVVTDHRVCIIKQKVIGDPEMAEYPIEQIKEGIMRIKADQKVGQFNLILKSGEWIETNKIPHQQLVKLEELVNAIVTGSYEVAHQ